MTLAQTECLVKLVIAAPAWKLEEQINVGQKIGGIWDVSEDIDYDVTSPHRLASMR
jgi:hypothetical protein